MKTDGVILVSTRRHILFKRLGIRRTFHKLLFLLSMFTALSWVDADF